MRERRLSQEGLKYIACGSMLLDHIGAVLLPLPGLRILGRVAFPLYCFLLAEGIAHTCNPGHYGLRLLICALLSELPHDLVACGGMDWTRQSSMVTLLIGFCTVRFQLRTEKEWLRLPVILFGAAAAEMLNADYGGLGVLLILMFAFTRNISGGVVWQTAGLALICWLLPSDQVQLLGVGLPIQMFGLTAMIPIAFYSGRKGRGKRWVQWAFYAFYPAHFLILYLLKWLCR